MTTRLMNNALAYDVGRAYVFNDYWWKHDYYPWPSATANQHDVRTPLNAIISGPTSGMPYDAGDPAPRSVHEDYWELACPPSERVIINTREVKKKAGPGEEVIIEGEGSAIWDAWKRKLKSVDGARCVEIVPAPREEDTVPQVFDLWFFGSVHSLSVWDRFRKSPVSRLLKTAGPVNSGIERNAHLFLPVGAASKIGPRDPFERMMAMHVRRGDYKQACDSLAAWNSTYYNWNLLPELPDHFPPPPGGGYGWNTPENIEKYMEHCLPEIPAIVKKARDSRDDYIRTMRAKRGGEGAMVDVMYLLTNDKSEWMMGLIEALRKDGWKNIKTSNDLELDQLQKDVNMAIDMDIARRAAVFIGNGVSRVFLFSVSALVFATRALFSGTTSHFGCGLRCSFAPSLVSSIVFSSFRFILLFSALGHSATILSALSCLLSSLVSVVRGLASTLFPSSSYWPCAFFRLPRRLVLPFSLVSPEHSQLLFQALFVSQPPIGSHPPYLTQY